jgi:hypothetical protein
MTILLQKGLLAIAAVVDVALQKGWAASFRQDACSASPPAAAASGIGTPGIGARRHAQGHTRPARRLRAAKGRKILIKGGNVVTMNDDKRDFTPGDILIDGDRIAAVDHKIDAADAFVIDAKGMIAIPGMIALNASLFHRT